MLTRGDYSRLSEIVSLRCQIFRFRVSAASNRRRRDSADSLARQAFSAPSAIGAPALNRSRARGLAQRALPSLSRREGAVRSLRPRSSNRGRRRDRKNVRAACAEIDAAYRMNVLRTNLSALQDAGLISEANASVHSALLRAMICEGAALLSTWAKRAHVTPNCVHARAADASRRVRPDRGTRNWGLTPVPARCATQSPARSPWAP
jgi:hypothetical protein